ncbi:aminodeoxychorismate/anthranilate synthase component II [Bacillus haikouensis]|jgi:anthranilate synthase component II|uniref:anthranilate synthase component II n=1 Tax=Bacillus haikouensis TaxID=1510468 RepID=UPI0015522B00|nr:aminodeoxychorismate/anthranilate synthase component II [Bacillus haikouensis]NQD67946.1 aminodeoxychorismate/anthranilate synthase component II [Bacillus haikouensis]
MILLIDNYDSFTYNLYQYIKELGEEVLIKRNDQVTLNEIQEMKPSGIVLSPGPGTPENAGICVEIIQNLHTNTPILGVCLGHQAIGAAFGANIVIAEQIMHGKTSLIRHDGHGLFQYLSQPLSVMRYHSLIIEKESLPPQFKIGAISMDDKEIMAIQHMRYPLFGVQFHPESIGTDTGRKMLNNFLDEMRKENNRETVPAKAI